MPKSVSNTFIYKNMDRGNIIRDSIVKILKDGKVLTPSDVDEAMIVINRYKFPMKAEVLKMFSEGRIRLVVPPLKVKLPSYMPFFLTKDAKGIVAIIDATVYGTMLENGNYKIEPKKLYCLLEGAYLSMRFYQFESSIQQKGTVILKGSAIYSNMFARVLNKQFSINVDKDKLQKVLFLSSKFFAVNVLGLKNGEMVKRYAEKNVTSLSASTIDDLDESFDASYFNDFASFIQGLKNCSPVFNLGLDELTVRGYLEGYIMMYDASTLLALEYFPYFMYMIECVINGGYINNQKLLEQVIGGDAAPFYAAIMNTFK